jgi:hypothetical protein
MQPPGCLPPALALVVSLAQREGTAKGLYELKVEGSGATYLAFHVKPSSDPDVKEFGRSLIGTGSLSSVP